MDSLAVQGSPRRGRVEGAHRFSGGHHGGDIMNRRHPFVISALLRLRLLLPALLLAVAAHAQAQEKPNILFILMDNLGYGELGVYGGGMLRGAPTPRIDTLAAESMRLLNFNVEAQCTPSRSA